MNFYTLTKKAISSIINEHFSELFDLIENTYILHGSNNTLNPPSYFLKDPDISYQRIIALPAHVSGDINTSGIKWISSNLNNHKLNLPRASAVIILNDSKTGFPFACMEGSVISAVRTAMSAVLAFKALSHSDMDNLGIVGTGFIAHNILKIFSQMGHHFEHIYLFDQKLDNANRFMQNHERFNLSVTNNLSEIFRVCESVLFTTTSQQPYVSMQHLSGNNPLILHISLRDLMPEVILSSYNVVDDIDHILNANTSVDLAFQQSASRDFISGTIDQFITPKKEIDYDKPVIFSPMGLGCLDIALAKKIFDIAKSQGSIKEVSNFFA